MAQRAVFDMNMRNEKTATRPKTIGETHKKFKKLLIINVKFIAPLSARKIPQIDHWPGGSSQMTSRNRNLVSFLAPEVRLDQSVSVFNGQKKNTHTRKNETI